MTEEAKKKSSYQTCKAILVALCNIATIVDMRADEDVEFTEHQLIKLMTIEDNYYQLIKHLSFKLLSRDEDRLHQGQSSLATISKDIITRLAVLQEYGPSVNDLYAICCDLERHMHSEKSDQGFIDKIYEAAYHANEQILAGNLIKVTGSDFE
jgi:hypothetical protein